MKMISAASSAGPYSPAVQSGNLLFVSGQIPLAADGSVAGEDSTVQVAKLPRDVRVEIEAIAVLG